MRQPRVYRDRRVRNALGQFYWCIDFTEPNGKRHRERTEATTKEEAQRILQRTMSQIAEARANGKDSIRETTVTVEEFMERHYRSEHEARCRKTTVEHDEYCMKIVRAVFGQMPLDSVTVENVNDWMNGMRRDGYAEATANRRRSILSGIFSLAERLGKIDRNPVKKVPAFKANNRKTRTFTFVEETEILKHCPEWLQHVVKVAVESGMRRGEIVGMRWEDVDIVRDFITIPETKNGQPRTIPMNARLKDVLLALRPHEITPKGHVFVADAEKGEPYYASSVSHAFEKAVRAARVKGEGRNSGSFHTLRHTVAYRLRKARVQELLISLLLGHSVENNITARYGRPEPEDLRAAVEALVELRKSGDLGTNGAPREVAKTAGSM